MDRNRPLGFVCLRTMWPINFVGMSQQCSIFWLLFCCCCCDAHFSLFVRTFGNTQCKTKIYLPPFFYLTLIFFSFQISAVTSTSGSGVSSELVIRPSASDHGSVFRCHVLHPALAGKPYEVSFTLQVLCKWSFFIFTCFCCCLSAPLISPSPAALMAFRHLRLQRLSDRELN